MLGIDINIFYLKITTSPNFISSKNPKNKKQKKPATRHKIQIKI